MEKFWEEVKKYFSGKINLNKKELYFKKKIYIPS